MDIKPIETVYNGYRFRSRLEARWAVFFDAIGAKYKYEPEGYKLEDGTLYLPDFYLENVSGRGTKNIFVEIKGALSEADLHKVEMFARNRNIIIFGDIPDKDNMMFYENPDDPDLYNLWYSEGDWYHTEPCASIHGGLVLDYPDNPYDYVDRNMTEKAFDIARQVRFEHGETLTAKQVYEMAHFGGGFNADRS